MKYKIGFIVGVILLSNNSFANKNPDFIVFALKQAHSNGVYNCDEAIKNTFKASLGFDVTILPFWDDDTKGDSLKLTGIYGSKGDSVFTEAEYRENNNKCYFTETSIITVQKSCIAYASEMKDFNYVSELSDYIVMKNKGGIPMFLKPLGSSCVVTFQRAGIF
jgi:hypothetical protein